VQQLTGRGRSNDDHDVVIDHDEHVHLDVDVVHHDVIDHRAAEEDLQRVTAGDAASARHGGTDP
jgi:hypothetical protein